MRPRLVWSIVPGPAVGAVPPRSPQQEHVVAIAGEAEEGLHSRVVAEIAGQLDTCLLQNAAQVVLDRHTATLRTQSRSEEDAPCMTLTELAEHRHVLAIEAPAESVDGVGLLRVLVEVASTLVGEPAMAREPQPTATELARYFRMLLADEDTAAGATYWQHASPELCSAPELSAALGHTGRRSPELEAIPVPIDAHAATRLAHAAACGGASREALILAAWRLLLTRLAPQEDGFVGVYRPGLAAELPEAVGLLGRYIPIPIATSGASTLAGLVTATDELLDKASRWVDFFTWQEPAPSGFCAAFRSLELVDPICLGEADLLIATLEAPIERVDIELRSLLVGNQFDLAVHVRTSAIDVRLAELLAKRLADLLAWLPEHLHRAVDDVELVARMRGPRAAHTAGPRSQSEARDVLALVDACASANPDALAVRHDASDLTYAELSSGAEAICAELVARGVRPGDSVALCMQRQPPLLAALLGTLRRGAHFVPLDPDHPSGRHAAILQDAAPRAILCSPETGALVQSFGTEVLLVDADLMQSGQHSPRAELQGSELAYVLYTSGSTGSPKGVEVSHAALLNYVRWAAERYVAPDGCGSLLHSSIAVDLTLTSLLVPLVSGQTVHMLDSNDPEDLARALQDLCGLSFLKLTPSGLALLGQMLSASEIARATRHLVVGGEQLTRAPLEALAASAEGLPVTNEYGPTETTVGSSAFTFRAGDPVPDQVPIGTPIWNTEIEIRDPHGTLCPAGIVGEIVISGAGVARGYRNRAAETAAHFVSDAHSGGVGYRTGDMGRIWDDGVLEYRGRRDEQTKIHGYRVETGEVEAVLQRLAVVEDAVVVAVHPQGDSSPFLSAFVVVTGGASPRHLSDLRELTQRELPWYACPDRLEVVDRLPRTSAGKPDRALLVTRSRTPVSCEVVPSGASTGQLAVLSEIWQRLLLRDEPQPDDNFFALGGDSIRALHFVAEARRAGLELSLRDIVDKRTLARIAHVATPLQPAGTRDAGPHAGAVPLTPNQLAFLGRPPADPHAWGLRWISDAPEPIKLDRLGRALQAVRQRHPALRCRFTAGDAWTARIARNAVGSDPELVDLSGLAAVEVGPSIEEHLARLEMRLDLDSGATSHLAVFDLGEARPQQVAWVVHHLVCDVVSLQCMTRELWSAYADGGAGQPPTLTEDAAYIAWARRVAPRTQALPTGASTRGAAEQMRQSLGMNLADVLTGGPQLVRQRRALVAVVAALLRSLAETDAAQPRACIELHGRDRPDLAIELAEVVGWLTTFHSVEANAPQLAFDGTLLGVVEDALSRAPDDPLKLPTISVNYLGTLADGPVPQLFSPVDHSARTLMFELEFVCWVDGGGLQAVWRHDTAAFDAATVERLAACFAQELPALARGATRSPVTPADFYDTSLSGADLARIMETFR